MRLIILAFLLYLLYRVVKGYLTTTANRHNEDTKGGDISEMVQDPVCKTFIRAKDAQRRVMGGKVYYFCSKECAERFESEREQKG